MKTENDVKRALGRLPESLKDSYNKIYSRILRIDCSGQSIAVAALQWLLCAQRPLSVEEFVAAVSRTPDDHILNLSSSLILDCCCNLVVLDKEQNVFRLSHLSVRE